MTPSLRRHDRHARAAHHVREHETPSRNSARAIGTGLAMAAERLSIRDPTTKTAASIPHPDLPDPCTLLTLGPAANRPLSRPSRNARECACQGPHRLLSSRSWLALSPRSNWGAESLTPPKAGP